LKIGDKLRFGTFNKRNTVQGIEKGGGIHTNYTNRWGLEDKD